MMHKKKSLAVTIAAIIGTAVVMEAKAVVIAPGMYQMTIDVTPTRTTTYGGTDFNVGSQARGLNSSFTYGTLPSNVNSIGLTDSDGDGFAGKIDFNVNASGVIQFTSYNVDPINGGLNFTPDVSLMTGFTNALEFRLTIPAQIVVVDGPVGPVLSQQGIQTFSTSVRCNLTGCLTGTEVAAVPLTPNYTATLISAGASTDFGDYFQVWASNATINYLGPVVVPIPAAVWLFGSGLLGLIGIARRKKAA